MKNVRIIASLRLSVHDTLTDRENILAQFTKEIDEALENGFYPSGPMVFAGERFQIMLIKTEFLANKLPDIMGTLQKKMIPMMADFERELDSLEEEMEKENRKDYYPNNKAPVEKEVNYKKTAEKVFEEDGAEEMSDLNSLTEEKVFEEDGAEEMSDLNSLTEEALVEEAPVEEAPVEEAPVEKEVNYKKTAEKVFEEDGAEEMSDLNSLTESTC